MKSKWKSPSCLFEAVQQEELEARAQHVETSEGVPYELCHQAGISGRRQGSAKSARAREVDGPNMRVVLHAGAALVRGAG